MYKQTIERFIDSPDRARWLYFKKMAVFVRKSVRLRERGVYLVCFDVANVEVVKMYQKQGVFTEFLEICEKVAEERGFHGIFVESVLNRHLWGFLGRKGYEIFAKGEFTLPNYYKEVNHDGWYEQKGLLFPQRADRIHHR